MNQKKSKLLRRLCNYPKRIEPLQTQERKWIPKWAHYAQERKWIPKWAHYAQETIAYPDGHARQLYQAAKKAYHQNPSRFACMRAQRVQTY